MKLILPCYFETTESESAENPTIDMLEIRRVVFYNVDSISAGRLIETGELSCSEIVAGGDSVLVPMKLKELEQAVDHAMNYGFRDEWTPWKINREEKEKRDAQN